MASTLVAASGVPREEATRLVRSLHASARAFAQDESTLRRMKLEYGETRDAPNQGITPMNRAALNRDGPTETKA